MKILTAMFSLTVLAVISGCSTAVNENTNTNSNANIARNANMNASNTNANVAQKGTREEYEKNRETYSQQAKQLGRKIGTGVDDGWLWTKTRFDLAAASDLSDSTINVDVDNAMVTLTGTVPASDQKAKAESIAKTVAAVKGVKNQLKVAPASTNANTKANTNKASK